MISCTSCMRVLSVFHIGCMFECILFVICLYVADEVSTCDESNLDCSECVLQRKRAKEASVPVSAIEVLDDI